MKLYYRYSDTFRAQKMTNVLNSSAFQEAKHKTSEVETTYIMRKWFIQKSKMVPSTTYIDIARTFTFYQQISWSLERDNSFSPVPFPTCLPSSRSSLQIHAQCLSFAQVVPTKYIVNIIQCKALWWKILWPQAPQTNAVSW